MNPSQTLTDVLPDADGDESDPSTVSERSTSRGTSAGVTADPDPDSDPTLTKDTLFELLKNQRRRDALEFLHTNDGRTTLSDMAEYIAAKENGVPIEAINSKQRKRVYIGLYQCHLPKMADAGVIDFEKNRGTIELRELASQLTPYLVDQPGGTAEPADEDTPDTAERLTAVSRSPRTAAVFSGIGVATLAGVAGVPGVSLIPTSAWAVVCAVTLLVSTLLPLVHD